MTTSIFVTAGHYYKNERVPRFKWWLCECHHVIRAVPEAFAEGFMQYLLCSPDIIPPGCDDETAFEEEEFTLANASYSSIWPG